MQALPQQQYSDELVPAFVARLISAQLVCATDSLRCGLYLLWAAATCSVWFHLIHSLASQFCLVMWLLSLPCWDISMLAPNLATTMPSSGRHLWVWAIRVHAALYTWGLISTTNVCTSRCMSSVCICLQVGGCAPARPSCHLRRLVLCLES
jgi:hypothetical protein